MTETPFKTLPLPVTTSHDVARWRGRIGVERSVAPSLVALTTGLVAVSSNQPKAMLLFVCASIVSIGLYFVVTPKDDEEMHPFPSTFLRRVPDIFVAVGVVLIMLGIGVAFPSEVALIPLFLAILLAALAALFSMALGAWITAMLYAVALVSLATFVALAFVA